MTTVSDLTKAIKNVRYNPVAMQRIVLDEIEKITNGENRIVDATNPVAFTIESAIVTSSAHMQQAESLVRRQYPSLAQTMEELYLHMADVDYIGRFASPAIANDINILFRLEDVYRFAVSIPGTNIRKITLPRNTEITVADVVLTAQYPIDIRVLPNNGISIVYDENITSPLQQLSTNVVDWFVTRIGEDDFINIKFSIPQFRITSYTANLNNTVGFKKTYSFVDQFHFCRAFIRDANDQWVEIKTTHSDQVYDPNTPTLALLLDGQNLSVTVPQIYFNNGLITDNIRIDIYSTLGVLDMRLENQPPTAYSIRWIEQGEAVQSVYSAPLNSMPLSCYSNSSITGGANEITLEDLRKRVINNALGNPDVPITPSQFETKVNLMGYDLVQNLDTITERVYLATRRLPSANYGLSRTSANCAIQLFSSTLEELQSVSTTYSNGIDRLVIKPNTLFVNNNGVTSLVSDSQIAQIRALSKDQFVNEVNAKKYIYTPFHYVLDTSGNLFESRPYHLNNPVGLAKLFKGQNETAALDVAIADYRIQYREDGLGYRLFIQTRSSQSFKDLDHAGGKVQVQLSYNPPGLTDRAVMRGVDVTPVDLDEFVYQFDIDTDFDINNEHQILLKSFHLIDLTPRKILAQILQDFDVVFILLDYSEPGLINTEIDTLVQSYDLPPHTTSIGVTHETLRIRFGDYLERLWQNSRSVVGPENYERYTSDVIAYYEEDVYERDLAGNIKIGYDAINQEITVNKLHSQGDVVLDNLGNPVIKHRAGDLVLDAFGQPILVGGVSNRNMVRQVDLLMIEGSYYFANSQGTVQYRDTLPRIIRDWVINDIDSLADKLLERTDLFFYPKTTTGRIPIIISDNNRSTIDADQTINISFTVDKVVFDNTELKQAIEATTLNIISEQLQSTTISLSRMEATVHATIGQDIIAVRISGLTEGLRSFTILDDSVLPQIGKQIVSLIDGTFAVQDAITFDFTRAVL